MSPRLGVAVLVLAAAGHAAAETFEISGATTADAHAEHHLHREIMLKKANSAGTRPKISIKVDCDQETDIRWIVYHDTPSKIMPSQSCPNAPPGRILRGEDEDDETVLADGHEYDEGRNGGAILPSTTNSSGGHGREYNIGCVRVADTVKGAYGCCNQGSGMTVLHKGPDPITAASMARKRILYGATHTCKKKQKLWVQLLHQGNLNMDGRITVHNEWAEDGVYSLYMEWKVGHKVRGVTSFLNLHGYLSAEKYPLMIFYGSMAIIYLLLGLFWAVLMALNHQDLLMLQYWIGGVIVTGMIEMAVSWADLQHLNNEANGGYRSQGLLIFAKLLSAAKNTVARLLVLVVCMGYGVVKPRLGDVRKQLLAVGCASFALFSLYGIVHEQEPETTAEDKTKAEIIIIIPLSVLDAAIFWWIFFSLHHTMKLLLLRQNMVKLTLYRRFQFTLGCCVLATVAFTLWTFTADGGLENDSMRNDDSWRNAWFTEWGFWQLLFFSILVTIMFLFRPTMNNARYAYAALDTDLEADDDYTADNTDGGVPHFGSETMTRRTLHQRGHGPAPKPKQGIEEELLWVEENIPASVTTNDGNFLNFPMDSDEEIMNTRFEASKME